MTRATVSVLALLALACETLPVARNDSQAAAGSVIEATPETGAGETGAAAEADAGLAPAVGEPVPVEVESEPGAPGAGDPAQAQQPEPRAEGDAPPSSTVDGPGPIAAATEDGEPGASTPPPPAESGADPGAAEPKGSKVPADEQPAREGEPTHDEAAAGEPAQPPPVPVQESAPPAEEAPAGAQARDPAVVPAAKSDPEDSSEDVLRDPVKSEIAILVRNFYRAYNEGDFSAAKACFWPNATITEVRELEPGDPPRVVVLGAPTFFQELELLSSGAGSSRMGRLAKEPKWRFASNVAQAWCEFVGEFKSGEEVMVWVRYDAFTFVHHEDKWLVAALVQSLSVDGE